MIARKTNRYTTPLWRLAVTMLLLGASIAGAQPSTADLFSYKVQKGDRLSGLLMSLLQLPDGAEKALQTLQKLNAKVDLHKLQAGQTLQIPKSWLQAHANHAQATQVQCTGNYWPGISRPDSRSDSRSDSRPDAKPLNVGDWVSEGSLLRVPAGCQVMLTLQDGSRIQMPSGAVMEIISMNTPKALGAPQVRLKLSEGRIGLDVFNKRPANSVFEVQTPKSLAGVRGTQLRVGFDSKQQKSQIEVLQGEAKNQGQADVSPINLPQGMGQWVDAQGLGDQPQKLLPAPVFKHYRILNSRTGAGRLGFSDVPRVMGYAWREGLAVNQFEVGVKPSSSALNLNVPSLGARAQVWYVSSLDRSGLQGLESAYALCHTEEPAAQGYCSIAFDTSSFNGRPMRMVLERLPAHRVSSTELQFESSGPDNGRIWVGALQPGVYRYELSYLPADREALEADHWVTQNGQFQLINVHTGPN